MHAQYPQKKALQFFGIFKTFQVYFWILLSSWTILNLENTVRTPWSVVHPLFSHCFSNLQPQVPDAMDACARTVLNAITAWPKQSDSQPSLVLMISKSCWMDLYIGSPWFGSFVFSRILFEELLTSSVEKQTYFLLTKSENSASWRVMGVTDTHI